MGNIFADSPVCKKSSAFQQLIHYITNVNSRPDYISNIKYIIAQDNNIIKQKLPNELSALMVAVKYSNTISNNEVVKLLIDAGSDINLQNNAGCTALIFAAKYSTTSSNNETVKMLIDAGANVNLQDRTGCTALMASSYFSNTTSNDETIKILIEADSNISILNNNGHDVFTIKPSNSSKISKYYAEHLSNKVYIKTTKKINYNRVLKSINTEYINKIKFKPGNMGYIITNLSFDLKSSSPPVVYEKIIKDNIFVLDYLGINSPDNFADTITAYLV